MKEVIQFKQLFIILGSLVTDQTELFMFLQHFGVLKIIVLACSLWGRQAAVTGVTPKALVIRRFLFFPKDLPCINNRII